MKTKAFNKLFDYNRNSASIFAHIQYRCVIQNELLCIVEDNKQVDSLMGQPDNHEFRQQDTIQIKYLHPQHAYPSSVHALASSFHYHERYI